MWCVSELDEEYIRRMEELLALYEKPLSEKQPVVCVDEKPVVLHADARPGEPMRPGRIARRDAEYVRRGTANVLCGVEPRAGKHFTRATANRSAALFADYLVEIAVAYPEAETIHLVMDNHPAPAGHPDQSPGPHHESQPGRHRLAVHTRQHTPPLRLHK